MCLISFHVFINSLFIKSKLAYFICFSNWIAILSLITNMFGFILLMFWNFTIMFESGKQKILNKMIKIYWILTNIHLVYSTMMLFVFWSKFHNLNILNNFMNLLTFTFISLEIFILAHPLKFNHILHSLYFILFYCFATYVQYLINTKNIHPVLNWQNKKTKLYCIDSIFFIFWNNLYSIVYSAQNTNYFL